MSRRDGPARRPVRQCRAGVSSPLHLNRSSRSPFAASAVIWQLSSQFGPANLDVDEGYPAANCHAPERPSSVACSGTLSGEA